MTKYKTTYLPTNFTTTGRLLRNNWLPGIMHHVAISIFFFVISLYLK